MLLEPPVTIATFWHDGKEAGSPCSFAMRSSDEVDLVDHASWLASADTDRRAFVQPVEIGVPPSRSALTSDTSIRPPCSSYPKSTSDGWPRR